MFTVSSTYRYLYGSILPTALHRQKSLIIHGDCSKLDFQLELNYSIGGSLIQIYTSWYKHFSWFPISPMVLKDLYVLMDFILIYDYLYIMSHVNLRSNFFPSSIKLLAPPMFMGLKQIYTSCMV